ncbi:hypothetical protein L1887_63148 [Cichorium endivia]|nr:hypothetical protein L1887_63148 [Cichorium endivia]
MIGRADIEGSKSNVAMNAWLPQASYPCGNFSDTLASNSEGSSFPADSAKPVPLAVVSLDSRPGTVGISLIHSCAPPKEPFPVRPPAGTRRPALAAEAARAVRRQPTGSGLGPPCPALRANPFPEVTDSILPTSLAYIVPSTRGCSPWRPDAVMSTTGRGRALGPPDFQGPPGGAPDTARRAVLFQPLDPTSELSRLARSLAPYPASGSSRIASSAYQKWPTWSSRFRGTAHRSSRAVLLFKNSHPGSSYPEGNFGGNQLLDGSISLSPPIPKSDERFARQYRCGPPPEFPLASPRSGIVHHLSGPDRHAHTRTLLRRSRLLGPSFQDGREWGAHRPVPGARRYIAETCAWLPTTIDATASPRAYRQLGLWPPHQSAPVHAPSRSADRLSPFHIRPGRIAGPQFASLPTISSTLDSLFKVLFIFPSRTAPRGATGSGHDGALTLSGAPFQGTWARSAAEDASPDYNSDSEGRSDFQAGLIPVRSPLLRESLYMFTGSFCFAGFDNDPSAGSPTETLLRLLLPLNDKVQWNSRGRRRRRTAHVAAILTLHRTIQSVGATGGVYKGQGRSQRELMTRAY